MTRLSIAAIVVSDWAAESGLRLNQGKTQAIFFASKRMITRINKLQLPGIALGSGVVAPLAETVKSLGVVLDRTLSWKPHLDHLSSKVHRTLYSLRFFRSSTTELLRHRLVKALIFPLLDYCSVVTVDATYEQQSRI